MGALSRAVVGSGSGAYDYEVETIPVNVPGLPGQQYTRARDRRIVRHSPPPSDCTVDTAAESYHQHLGPFRKKTSTPEKCSLEPNQSDYSGTNPVSARVFWGGS